jgi:hypothetical protein
MCVSSTTGMLFEFFIPYTAVFYGFTLRLRKLKAVIALLIESLPLTPRHRTED